MVKQEVLQGNSPTAVSWTREFLSKKQFVVSMILAINASIIFVYLLGIQNVRSDWIGVIPFSSPSALSNPDLAVYPVSPSISNPRIHWKQCGENIDCGRLLVPLDYHDLSLGTADLAVARYRATNTTTGKLGTIFTNPGGPGGSGVSLIYSVAAEISVIVDGRYDIVSWDPRGVNNTKPRVDCFDSQMDQDIFNFHTFLEVGLEFRNLSDPIDLAVFTSNVRTADAQNAAWVQRCLKKSGPALRHVGTATTARDLEYLSRVIEGNDTQVNYWGFSYGTILGSYFVNMFPHRVGRIILDGVADPHMWANMYPSELYKYDYADAETKTFAQFVDACQEAGSTRCALAYPGSSARSIIDKIDDLLDELYRYPSPVMDARRPGILTSGMVKTFLFRAMYNPRDWPSVAEDLALALHGNSTALMNSIQRDLELDSSVKPDTLIHANSAVICVDAPAFPDDMAITEVLSKYVDEVVVTYMNATKKFAATHLSVCHHWKVRETERFVGPFDSSLANPILIIGNTADPTTPLKGALAVNNYLRNDSRLLIQDGPGHCSMAMASLCTGKAVRKYFLHGELPLDGLICPADELLFPPRTNSITGMPDEEVWQSGVLDQKDRLILKNLILLGKRIQHYFTLRRT